MKTDLVIQVSELTKKKLLKKKDDEGFADKTFGEYLDYLVRDVHLEDTYGEVIQRHTRSDLQKMWTQNLAHNLQSIWDGDTIADLVPEQAALAEKEGKDSDVPLGTGIVIGRGPSLYKHKHLELLASSDYRGTVVCTDGALIDTLSAGVRPDLLENFFVVTVDGNKEKIWKWFDHELVDKYGPQIKAVLPSSCAPNVAERCKKAKAHVYWYHPLFDDWRNIESYTRMQEMMTIDEKHTHGVPGMNAGGNAGACAWIFAFSVLRRSPVALIGIDLGYLPETPLESTYYWNPLMTYTAGNMAVIEAQFNRFFNPDFNVEAVVDPVFKHYREAWLELAKIAPGWVETWNCSEGGSLFGEGIKGVPFREFLEKFKR